MVVTWVLRIMLSGSSGRGRARSVALPLGGGRLEYGSLPFIVEIGFDRTHRLLRFTKYNLTIKAVLLIDTREFPEPICIPAAIAFWRGV